MGTKSFAVICVAVSGLVVLPIASAQNADNAGAVVSQDSIVQPIGADDMGNTEVLQHNEVLAAETNLNISAGFMHTQYHENLPAASGDDESGFTPGFTIGASVLLPRFTMWPNVDLYSALSYAFNAGNLSYNGHEENLITGVVAPFHATDRTVFNRIEGRAGLGFPMLDGIELIPYLAAGYQAWNRNADSGDVFYGDEDYTSVLLGGGLKFDAPVTPSLVLTADAEMLAIIGGSVANNDYGITHGMGGSAEERVSLGLDDAVAGPWHVFANADWEHFNYAGFKPTDTTIAEVDGNYYYIYEPLSTTTQFGANVGVAYSF